jgi:hypothetical protein
MEIKRVFIVAFDDAERTAIANTIPFLRKKNLPVAADELQGILDRYDDGEALTASDINRVQIWVKHRLGKSNWTEEMRRASL